MAFNYEVGDKVLIRRDLNSFETYGENYSQHTGVMSSMIGFAGTMQEVLSVTDDSLLLESKCGKIRAYNHLGNSMVCPAYIEGVRVPPSATHYCISNYGVYFYRKVGSSIQYLQPVDICRQFGTARRWRRASHKLPRTAKPLYGNTPQEPANKVYTPKDLF